MAIFGLLFGLLWILNAPFREVYVSDYEAIPALADGLLLAPGAHWQDWFTQGYSHFWDLYPEWPPGNYTAFTRPAFQFVIYLAHFALGRDWASYQIINCFAASGMAAVAFLIARTALGLRTGSSLLAAALVLLSPPVLVSWLRGLPYAHEPLASLVVAGAFFAVVARRDFLCLILLFVALSTRENAVWAPLAAAVSIMLRPKPDESLRRRTFIAAAMFLPVVVWLGLRFAFFGGIGGTYVTAGYTSLADFLSLTLYKLKYVDALFMSPNAIVTEGRGALLDRVIKLGTRLLIFALFCLWALRILPETVKHLRNFVHEKCWPTMDPTFLVALWAATGLAFYFALPASNERYATSVVVFAWPALVAEADRRRKAIIWLGLAVCCVVSLTRSSHRSIETLHNYHSTQNALRSMSDTLRQVPPVTRRVYVVLANQPLSANPEYLRVFLGVNAEIVIVTAIYWACGEANDFAAFDHNTVDGVVNINVTLPACASFDFWPSPLDGTALANGRLYRNDTISYDLPEAYPISPKNAGEFYLGRKMTVHVRPNGPARFIILRGGRKGYPAWVFDTP